VVLVEEVVRFSAAASFDCSHETVKNAVLNVKVRMGSRSWVLESHKNTPAHPTPTNPSSFGLVLAST